MNTGPVDPQIVADRFLRVFNVMAQNGHHKLARSLSGLARVTRVDDNLWDAICYNSASDKRTLVKYACQKGDVDRLSFLLPHCGAEELYLECDHDGPLFIAIANGHTEVVALLCKYILEHKIGRLLDVRAADGKTLLMVAAAATNRADMMACLISHGCDLEAYVKGGDTMLVQAVKRNDIEMVDLLCTLGVDLDNKIATPLSALQHAVWENNVPIATLLCDRGADVQQRTTFGRSLCTVVRHKHGRKASKEMIAMLYSRGAPQGGY